MEDTDSKKLPSPLPHTCNICSKGFTEERDLTAHMSCHKKETPFKCDEGGKAYAAENYLRLHQRRHTGVRPFQCRYCEQRFYRSSDRSKHEKIHLNKRTYLCYLCGASFHQNNGLHCHTQRHHNKIKPSAPHVAKLSRMKNISTTISFTNILNWKMLPALGCMLTFVKSVRNCFLITGI